MTSLYVSVCRNAPGMSNIATALYSYASMRAIRKTASVHAVGDVASYLLIYACCLMTCAHDLTFTSPFIFSFKNINEEISFCIISLVISLGSWGMKVCILCSRESSFLNTFPPLAPSSFSPLLRLYCVIMMTKINMSL